MARTDLKIGLTADLFGKGGKPMFGDGPLELLSKAGLSWTVLPPDEKTIAADALAGFDALFIGGSRVTEAPLAADTGRLRIIACNGVGYDAVDTEALTRRGILLTNTPIDVRNGVATSALAFILALSLRMPLKSRLPKEGRWAQRVEHPGVGLPGRTLGIVGLGGIGRELVRLIAPFGMRIVASDPFLSQADVDGIGVELLALDDVLSRSDFVVIACPLNDSTRHLIDASRLAHMKRSAFLVNIARGAVIDEAALIAALNSGAIAGAGLDVFEQEPPDPANPLLSMESVIATAHSLCWTDSFLDGVARSAIRGIIATLEGKLPAHVVNEAAAAHPRARQWLVAS